MNFNSKYNQLLSEILGPAKLYLTSLLHSSGITKFTINSDYSVDVDQNCNISESLVRDGKLAVRFRHVSGSFDCSHNSLTSLQGCPSTIGGSFYCNHNSLSSLQGCPSEIGGSFNCSDNRVKFTEKDVRAVCNVKGIIYVQ